MGESNDRAEAMLHAMALLIQDLYAQAYYGRPQDLDACEKHLTHTLQFGWEMPPGSSEASANRIMRIQPKAAAELTQMFDEIRKRIRSLPPIPPIPMK